MATTVNRVGVVVKAEVDVEQASQFISSNYLADPYNQEKWHDINLGLLKREKLAQKKSNIWFRINPDRQKNGDVDTNKVVVLFDVNTLPGEHYAFDKQSAENFIKEASVFLTQYAERF